MSGLLLACAEPPEAPPEPDAFPDPRDDVLAGPGGPTTSSGCTTAGSPCRERPRTPAGGVSLYELADPCAPAKVGEAYSERMRESHTLAIAQVGDRTILAVDAHRGDDAGGIGFWDLADPTAPAWITDLELPGCHYPDAYFRVALSTFWQGDVLYVSAGLLGVFAIDVSDPSATVILSR
jgi:hypothetical protein